MDSLQTLARVRSQRATDILAFLEGAARELKKTGWYRSRWQQSGEVTQQQITADEINVELNALTGAPRLAAPTPASPQATQPQPDRASASRNPLRRLLSRRRRPESDGTAARDGYELLEEIAAARYELPLQAATRKETRWSALLRGGGLRLAVKGAPGSGKSFSSSYAVAARAEAQAQLLRDCKVRIEALSLPVWLRAKALAQASGATPAEVLIDAWEKGGARLSERVRQWIRATLARADGQRLFLVLDALDELADAGEEARFAANIKLLNGLTQASIVVTCRTKSFPQRRALLDWASFREAELAPMKEEQQALFITRFFPEEAARNRLRQLLERNFNLRHACRAPLLLAFACLLHEENLVTESTTYPQLYTFITRHLVTGVWREASKQPEWAKCPPDVAQRLAFLARVGWHLFQAQPSDNSFTDEQWHTAARRAKEADPDNQLDATEFLKDLLRVGAVVDSGFNEDGAWEYSLTHRTLLEYLAAEGLLKHDPSFWCRQIAGHIWCDAAWVEVARFAGGLTTQPAILLRALAKEKDDIFRTALRVQTDIVGTNPHVQANDAVRVTKKLLSSWRRDDAASYLELGNPMLQSVACNSAAADYLQVTLCRAAGKKYYQDSFDDALGCFISLYVLAIFAIFFLGLLLDITRIFALGPNSFFLSLIIRIGFLGLMLLPLELYDSIVRYIDS